MRRAPWPVAFLLWAIACAPRPAQPPDRALGYLSGTLLDSTSAPVAGALVRVRPYTIELPTNSAGDFEGSVPAGVPLHLAFCVQGAWWPVGLDTLVPPGSAVGPIITLRPAAVSVMEPMSVGGTPPPRPRRE